MPSKVWDEIIYETINEIIYQSLNFNGAVEV